MQTLKLPIGISDFKETRERGYYYVDKSLFIRDVIHQAGKILLLPRPRRFGKTLNLSMLRYFFERAEENQAHLFQGLAIEQDAEVMAHQGQFPLISLTFKDVKSADFETCIHAIHQAITQEFERHVSHDIGFQTLREERQWQAILNQQADRATLMNSLSLLMSILRRVYGQRVVVLIDEYDAPIHAGYQYGYYDDIVMFMRNLLSGGFKDNSNLEKGVISGILRISRESIFSGLNNLDVYSLLNLAFAEYFGFTEDEVTRLLHDFHLADSEAQVREWYNGYRFGTHQMYNPWSVINFVTHSPEAPQPYWLNSGGNELVRELILEGNQDVRTALERLMLGETVSCPLNDNIVLRDLRSTAETVLNLLVYSGYLKPVRQVGNSNRPDYELAVPNQEVGLFYEDSVRLWLHQQIGSERLRRLLQAFTQGDIATFGKILQDMALSVLSYHDVPGDEPERVYHAFVLGLLIHLQDRYTIRSNRESGYGRYDVILIPHETSAPGFVLEFKKIDQQDDTNHQDAMQSALQQIRDKEYAAELQALGIRKITGIGIVVDGKRVWVESVEL